jgi:hypothetical protein
VLALSGKGSFGRICKVVDGNGRSYAAKMEKKNNPQHLVFFLYFNCYFFFVVGI